MCVKAKMFIRQCLYATYFENLFELCLPGISGLLQVFINYVSRWSVFWLPRDRSWSLFLHEHSLWKQLKQRFFQKIPWTECYQVTNAPKVGYELRNYSVPFKQNFLYNDTEWYMAVLVIQYEAFKKYYFILVFWFVSV